MLYSLKLCLLLLLVSLSSKADCLPDAEGLCTPGVTIDEQVTVEKTVEYEVKIQYYCNMVNRHIRPHQMQ